MDQSFRTYSSKPCLKSLSRLSSLSTTLSDLNGMLDRYEGVLRNFFSTNEQNQIDALKTIEEFWTFSHFHIIVIFDKLVRRELIHIKTMAKYLIERLTGKGINLEKSCLYYKALKTCLTVVSLNRKKLEADNSEKVAPLVRSIKSDFSDIIVNIVEVNC